VIGALAILALSSTTSADVRVLVLPSVTRSVGEGARAVSAAARQSFDEAFRDVAEGTFAARRIAVVSPEELGEATRRLLGDTACITSACASELARRTQATSWLIAVVVGAEGGCRARATLYDLRKNQVTLRRELDVMPCTPERLVMGAEDLARQAAEGPRLPERISLSLTPLSVPDLGVATLDDVGFTYTSTALRAQKTGLTLARAAELYRRYEFALRPNARGDLVAVRGSTPITDCELMTAAGVRESEAESRACRGNWWELAWIGAPVGAVMLVPTLGSDQVSAPLAVTSLVLLLGGPALALLLNEDATDPVEGEHVVDAARLQELVLRANATLRKELVLTEAEAAIGPIAEP
jgi:hypothetical protein